jgi:hypothetical protein
MTNTNYISHIYYYICHKITEIIGYMRTAVAINGKFEILIQESYLINIIPNKVRIQLKMKVLKRNDTKV